jgi:hypothetical protein
VYKSDSLDELIRQADAVKAASEGKKKSTGKKKSSSRSRKSTSSQDSEQSQSKKRSQSRDNEQTKSKKRSSAQSNDTSSSPRRRRRQKNNNSAAILVISACIIVLILLLFSGAVAMGFAGDYVRLENIGTGWTVNFNNKANKLTIINYVSDRNDLTDVNKVYTEAANAYVSGEEVDVDKVKTYARRLALIKSSCTSPYTNLQRYSTACSEAADSLSALNDMLINLGSTKYYKLDKETADEVNALIEARDKAFENRTEALKETFEANDISYSVTSDGTIIFRNGTEDASEVVADSSTANSAGESEQTSESTSAGETVTEITTAVTTNSVQ